MCDRSEINPHWGISKYFFFYWRQYNNFLKCVDCVVNPPPHPPTCTRTCICLCTYASTYVHMYVCMYVCMYVRTYVCIRVCAYIWITTFLNDHKWWQNIFLIIFLIDHTTAFWMITIILWIISFRFSYKLNTKRATIPTCTALRIAREHGMHNPDMHCSRNSAGTWHARYAFVCVRNQTGSSRASEEQCTYCLGRTPSRHISHLELARNYWANTVCWYRARGQYMRLLRHNVC